MYNWHSDTGTDCMSLINSFIGYEYEYDCGRAEISDVRILDKVFGTEVDARTYTANVSYGSDYAYLAAYTSKKLSKAYIKAFNNFKEKRKEYISFKNSLTIAYGRTSSRVTCPNCNSAINLAYGSRFRRCPICGSEKIISDSNWKSLEAKKRLMYKASEHLQEEAVKNGVTFMCAFQWHN